MVSSQPVPFTHAPHPATTTGPWQFPHILGLALLWLGAEYGHGGVPVLPVTVCPKGS